ncbi:MAG TPA: ATP synthase F1 subunit epsilon [Candidatus Eisenbacteria bacterium]|nr:ATP synthase F1 subunit epsilon [Candidatus Eisenbacteria bacterium]
MASEAAFRLKVVTPDEVFYEGDVVSLVAPAALGFVGILKNHAPYVTTVSKGNLTLREDGGQTRQFQVEGGFLDVQKNRVLVLTDKVRAAAAA